jgi:hypothetical protein
MLDEHVRLPNLERALWIVAVIIVELIQITGQRDP